MSSSAVQAGESARNILSSHMAQTTELDSAILAYLAKRGFPRSAKAFEKEANVKSGDSAQLEAAWKLLKPAT